MSETHTRQVPWSKDAEMSVLGALLMDGEKAQTIRDQLPPGAFHATSNRRIYDAILRIADRGDTVDAVTLAEELRASGDLDAAGGMARLGNLVDQVPSASNLETHAKIIRDKATARRLIKAGERVADLGFDAAPGRIEKAVDEAEATILSVAKGTADPSGYTAVGELVMPWFDEIERARENPGMIRGLETGFSQLDSMTNGLEPGELWVVAGRPSMGKTSLVLDVVRHAAVGEGHPGAIYSLEMPARDVLGRLVCAQARVAFTRTKEGRLRDEEYASLADAAGAVRQAPLQVVDTTGLTIHGLRSSARRIRDREGLDFLAVDYLQLMRGPQDAGNREQEIAAISRSLKELALELEIPVLAVSQLSRAPELRSGNARPRLSDLRESGAIEQDGDVILFVYREEYYLEASDPRYGEVRDRAELIIGKQRNGPAETVDLFFREELPSFDQVAPHQRGRAG